MMRHTLLALAVALIPAAGLAEENPPPDPTPPGPMDEALERVLETLRFILRAIPQYEMPEVLPNGDIIIRRVPPTEDETPAPKPKQRPLPESPPDEAHT